MNLVAIDRAGNHVSLTTADDERTYVFRRDGMVGYDELPRTLVAME